MALMIFRERPYCHTRNRISQRFYSMHLCKTTSKIKYGSEICYGLLFFIVFAVLSTDRDAGLPVNVSASISGKLGPAMGGYFARRVSAAGIDTYLHLSEHGLLQHLVCGPSDSDDTGVFRRRQRDASTTSAPTR